MAMLVVSSIVSVAVVVAVGFVSGGSMLRATASERLLELLESQKRAVEMLFADLTNSLVVCSRGFTAAEAVQAFKRCRGQMHGFMCPEHRALRRALEALKEGTE